MNPKHNLTKIEIKELVRLLAKVKLPAPYEVFVAISKALPMVAVNLAVMDGNKILLTHRKDEFYNCWHIPGVILRTGENPKDAVVRVGESELGFSPKNFRFVNYFFEDTVRGFEVVLLFAVKSQKMLSAGTYYSLHDLPSDFLKEQQNEIDYLKNI